MMFGRTQCAMGQLMAGGVSVGGAAVGVPLREGGAMLARPRSRRRRPTAMAVAAPIVLQFEIMSLMAALGRIKYLARRAMIRSI